MNYGFKSIICQFQVKATAPYRFPTASEHSAYGAPDLPSVMLAERRLILRGRWPWCLALVMLDDEAEMALHRYEALSWRLKLGQQKLAGAGLRSVHLMG